MKIKIKHLLILSLMTFCIYKVNYALVITHAPGGDITTFLKYLFLLITAICFSVYFYNRK